MRSLLGLLTPTGWSVMVGGLGSLVAGVVLNWQEFTQLGVVAALLVVLALAWVRLPGAVRATVAVRPARLTQGREARLALDVRAGGLPRLPTTLAVPCGPQLVPVRLPALGPGGRTATEVPVTGLPRGVWPVGPVVEERGDPLGLARRRVDLGAATQVWVRPRTVTPTELASSTLADLEGLPSEQISMSDLSFHALREYVPGDDLRHVHWRSSAKADQLLVRQYHESRRGQATVLLDHEAPSYAGDEEFELAVSVAASLALRGAADVGGGYLRCGADAVQARTPAEVLDLACRFQRSTGGFAAVLQEAAAVAPAAGLALLVTGSRRPAADVRATASGSLGEADHVIVRVDAGSRPAVASTRGARTLTVGALEQLPGLLARGLR